MSFSNPLVSLPWCPEMEKDHALFAVARTGSTPTPATMAEMASVGESGSGRI